MNLVYTWFPDNQSEVWESLDKTEASMAVFQAAMYGYTAVIYSDN